MARRRSEPGLIEVALKSDWRFSAGLAAVGAIVGLVVVPAVASGNPFLTAVAPLGRAAGIIFAATFGLIAVGKLLLGRQGAPEQPSRPMRWTPAPVPRAVPKTTAVFYDPSDDRPPGREQSLAAKPTTWSLELLQSLDWKRFEEVVAAYFSEKGFRSQMIACGPDGGIDVRLFFGDAPAPVGVVQCKAWGKRPIGVASVRELLGVMAHEKVTRGYFAATGEFSADAAEFAKTNPIMLISGRDFLTAIAKMDAGRSAALLDKATAGDYTTPTCPSCGIKLYKKTFRNGGAAWVCRGYPECRTKIRTKQDDR